MDRAGFARLAFGPMGLGIWARAAFGAPWKRAQGLGLWAPGACGAIGPGGPFGPRLGEGALRASLGYQ